MTENFIYIMVLSVMIFEFPLLEAPLFYVTLYVPLYIRCKFRFIINLSASYAGREWSSALGNCVWDFFVSMLWKLQISIK